MDRRRAVVVALTLVAMVGVLAVLIAGVDNLEVGPGRVVQRTSQEPTTPHAPDASTSARMALPDFFQIFLVIALAMLVLAVAVNLRTKRLRPALLFGLALLAVLVLVLNFIGPWGEPQPTDDGEKAENVEIVTAEPPSEAPAAVETDLQTGTQGWTVVVTTILAVLLVALLAVAVLAYVLRRRKRRATTEADGIVEIASQAIREIDDGADPVGVVQRCYSRMVRILSKRTGLDPEFRTPREFAVDLRELGFTHASVAALTEMFELVRYGGRDDRDFAARARGSLVDLRRSAGAPG